MKRMLTLISAYVLLSSCSPTVSLPDPTVEYPKPPEVLMRPPAEPGVIIEPTNH